MPNWFEREEDEITRLYNEGQIDQKEYDRQMRELARAARDEAEDAARDAYDRTINNY